MDLTKFFNTVRVKLFGGTLTQGQVDGINAILDGWQERGRRPDAGLAYIMATNWWEARLPPDWKPRMQPVEEVGKGSGREYGRPDPVTGFVYYGRGDVQLTWADNYKRLGKALGLDLYGNPALALDPVVSKCILIEGMIGGLYTPAAGTLDRYFPPGGTPDFVGARAMVNGTDRAAEIADLGRKFYAAILGAG